MKKKGKGRKQRNKRKGKDKSVNFDLITIRFNPMAPIHFSNKKKKEEKRGLSQSRWETYIGHAPETMPINRVINFFVVVINGD